MKEPTNRYDDEIEGKVRAWTKDWNVLKRLYTLLRCTRIVDRMK